MDVKIKCPKCQLEALPNEWMALYGHCPGCGEGKIIESNRVIDALLAENERLQKKLETEQTATWDDGKEFADIWRTIIEFNNTYYPDWKNTEEVYLSNALAGECGEICNMTKHRAGGGTNKRDHDDVDLLEELADLFIYMELLIATKGYTLGIFAESIRAKIKKNIERVGVECVCENAETCKSAMCGHRTEHHHTAYGVATTVCSAKGGIVGSKCKPVKKGSQ